MLNVTCRNSTEFLKNCQYLKNNKSKNFLKKIQNVETLLKKENKLTNEHKRDLKNYAEKLRIEKQKNDLLDIYLLSKKQKRILKNFAGENWISLYRKVKYKTLILLTVIICQINAMDKIMWEYSRAALMERLKRIYPNKNKNFWYQMNNIINVHLIQKRVLKLQKHQKHNSPYCKDFLANSTNSVQQLRVIPNSQSCSSYYTTGKKETNNENRYYHIYANILKKNISEDILTQSKKEKQEQEKRFLELKERFLNLSIEKYKERKSRVEQAIIYNNEFEGKFRECFSIRNKFRAGIESISNSSIVSEFYYDVNPRKHAKFRTTANGRDLNSREIKAIAEEYHLKKIEIEPMLKRSANKLFYVGHPILTKIIRDFYHEFGKISWENRNMRPEDIKKLEIDLESMYELLKNTWLEEEKFIRSNHPTKVVRAWKIRIGTLKRKLKPEQILPEHVKESLREQGVQLRQQREEAILNKEEEMRQKKLSNQKLAISLERQNKLFGIFYEEIISNTAIFAPYSEGGIESLARVGISKTSDIVGLLERKDQEIMKSWLNKAVKNRFFYYDKSSFLDILEDVLKAFDINIFVERFKRVLNKRLNECCAKSEEKEAAKVLKIICPLLGID